MTVVTVMMGTMVWKQHLLIHSLTFTTLPLSSGHHPTNAATLKTKVPALRELPFCWANG